MDNINDFEDHGNHFHHARIAIVDSISSTEREPDLSFMPRIEEKEEDFLESTVDDDSDEERSISPHEGLVALHSSTQVTDNNTFADKTYTHETF